MKDLLLFLVENIVSTPEEVSIEESKTAAGEITLEIRVSPMDMGMVIGKGGKIIRALRNIVKTKAILENKRVNIVLVE